MNFSMIDLARRTCRARLAVISWTLAISIAAHGAAHAAARPVGPVRLSAAESDSLREVITNDRAETGKWLQSAATSYLATVLRRDFDGKFSLTVGSAADVDVRLRDEAIRPHHLRVTVIGDSFWVETVDAGATFAVGGRDTSSARLVPSTIKVGRYGLRLSHQRFPALIVFDPQSPRFKDYKGMSYYPIDLKWRFVVPLTPNPRPDTTIIESTRGNRRHAIHAGWFEFVANGKQCRLAATRLLEPGVGEHDLSVFFRDATTGKETYGVGRYLDPEPLGDGRYVLDFNLAYNPACAFSEHYNCPIPLRENRLPIAVRVGDRDPHYYEH
ncbi:MAG: DUF1684 domain-containing protein [Candidatus Eisenbacteria bacterium]|uniref:DUF1684 domain-containing protein n=1 Tax=Eiseniibacteriota bacterium TaxID=2212470 RepID=A0A849SZQ5_UNCEI|nr:DUF1684 domain-containing protein [Candidatus Eisenbacteria bacterium]